VRSPEWRCSAGSAIWVLCLSLCAHFDSLAHGVEFTGDARAHRFSRAEMCTVRDLLRARVRALAPLLPEPVPAGWLEDQPVVRAALVRDRHGGFLRGTEPRVELSWHSWLTQLWHVRRVQVAAWTPGGPPAVAAAGIEWRTREPR
jgi:hypothetical protein